MSYGKIVNKYFGIQLDKKETNSNWLSTFNTKSN